MRQFYERVLADAESLRFFVHCEICGKKEYGAKVPILCRSARALARCTKGTAANPGQALFNRTKANSTQLLAIRFNQCRHCYRWVCDDCYDNADSLGACRECSKTNGK